MLDFIMPSTNPGVPRTIPNWVKLINDTDRRLDVFRQRLVTAPVVMSPCMNFLKFVVSNIDWQYLLTSKSIYDKYTRYIAPTADGLRVAYDPISGANFNGVFSRPFRGQKIPEFCLNVQVDKPMQTLPLGEDWNTWKNWRPVRIVWFDSLELPHDLTNCQLWFRSLPPTHVITSFNYTMFILKTMKYIEANGGLANFNVHTYLQREIVLSWFNDILDIWILNFLMAVLTQPHFDIDQLSMFSQIGGAPVLNQLSDVATDELTRLQEGTTLLENFLETPWLSQGKSLRELIHIRLKEEVLPDLRQYKYLEFLSEYPIVKIIAVANMARGNQGAGRKIKLALTRMLDRYENMNIVSHVTNPILKQKLITEIKSLYLYTQF